MEEKILEIIIDHQFDFVDNRDPQHSIAKEITSHIMEFIEWIIHNTMEATTYSPLVYLRYQTKEEVINHGGSFFDLTKEHHLDDIYQYWLNNINEL